MKATAATALASLLITGVSGFVPSTPIPRTLSKSTRSYDKAVVVGRTKALQAVPQELDAVVNLVAAQDPVILAGVGAGLLSLAAVIAMASTTSEGQAVLVGQSPEELEAERRLAAEEAERARQAVIEAKVMEVRNEAQTLVQEIRKTTDAKVQSIKASSRTQIKETITEATTRIQLINTQAERRIQRVREGSEEETEMPVTLNTAQVSES